MVTQAMPSTKILESLPEGAIVRAWDEFNGVVYLLLKYEATGEGEIGSFPSPNYSKSPISIDGVTYAADDLIPRYSAFQNLKKINQDFYSDFKTIYLTLAEDKVVDIQLQPEYDGSVNVIFTDDTAPLRLINSRFSVLPDNKFQIIDRQGTSDTNLYNETTLLTTIQLILQSDSIVKVDLDSVTSGGTLRAGNYRYYFAYETADGNATNIVAQSSLVSVFFGDTLGTVRGGKENEKTDKAVRFVLSGLNTAYSRLRVYFDYSAGDASNQTTLYRIDATFSITGGKTSFTHTGAETIIQTEVSTVQTNFASIDTVKSICQIGPYLVGANVKEKITDYSSMINFAKRTILSSGYEYLPLTETVSLEDSMATLLNTKLTNAKLSNGFYGGGYANPMNIYYKLGYMDGEGYVFGIVYIMSDGSLSPVFPLVGFDNLQNQFGQHAGGYISKFPGEDFTYKDIPDYGPAQIDALTDGFDATPGIGLNTKGIYRFPNRNNNFPKQFVSNGSAAIQHLLVHVPQVKPENTIGAMFVRAPRVPDRIAQGYAVPTFKLRQSETTFYTHTDFTSAQLTDESYYKVLPIVGGLVETIKTDVGPFHRAIKVRRGIPRGTILDSKRVSIIIPDMFGNPAELSQTLNNLSISVEFAARVTARRAAPFDLTNALNNWYATQRVASVLQTSSIDNIVANSYPGGGSRSSIRVNGRSYYTGKASALYNAGLFTSSSEAYLMFRVPGSIGSSINNDDYFMHLSASYNDYIGLVLANNTNLISRNIAEMWPESGNVNNDTGLDAKDWNGGTILMSYLVNIYPNGGQRNTSILRDIYQNTNSLSFMPINQRMTWEEIEGQLDAERNIKLYGGDCFTTASFRRVYNTNMEPASKPTLEPNAVYFSEDKKNAKTGQVITLVTQNANNPYFRNSVSELVNERKQAWLPYMDGSQSDIRNWRSSDFMEPEPDGYNRGYSVQSNSVPIVPYDVDAPYIANHWFNRIVYFGPHIISSFTNSYRSWTGVNYKDYESKFGAITAVRSVNNMLACVWENALGFIPFQERTYGGASETGQVFVESETVLGPRATIISSLYGSRHMNSLIASDNALYGVDAKNRKIWVLTPQGADMFSDFSLHPYLEKYATSYASQKIRPGYENIVAGFNKFFSEVWFTFLSSNNPEQNFTIVYNEKFAQEGDIRCSGFFSGVPYCYMRIGEKMLSLNSATDKNVIWEHDKYSEGFLKIYGINRKMKLGFVVNPESDVSKVYDNLRISSNRVFPERIIWTVDGAKVEQEIIPATGSNIISSNADYENGRVFIPVPEAKDVTNDPIRAFLRNEIGNFDSEIEENANMQGRAMEVVLQYGGNKPIEILSTETIVRLPL